MARENLYQPFDIVYKELDECPMHMRQHNFFELVYIIKGEGQQQVNNNTFQYHPGHLFLLTPQDTHQFKIADTTGFFFLRFNDIYLKAQSDAPLHTKAWLQRMEFILQNASHQPGCILYNAADKAMVDALIAGLLKEQQGQQVYHLEVTQQLVNTLITIVARNIAMKLPAEVKDYTSEVVLEIIRYIQEHIYAPEKLKAEVVAKKFGISVSYLGRYFKKNVGENMQDYITRYKLKLVEIRLQHSDMRINEIAWEFNFTDESHLNRLFKKHLGMNPSVFRKNWAKRA
ncbi:AraC family transcriptional regulator [Chitinophaga nivalis]|uniref:AraC family transcriptional regulator n=1 Tax=Chitinophaga nivalis TaxID=2991709 RepID=A0ABT3IRS6_9BACT|nr:AraC family transcriptional regulator [Chitinophaga nivalis]MCW3463896.1 AraC family transcriptional regulator [Chitinophaga nivalis]MCW3486414.1 AraC family transcriptional regulator [Chitinophaga nivalis]